MKMIQVVWNAGEDQCWMKLHKRDSFRGFDDLTFCQPEEMKLKSQTILFLLKRWDSQKTRSLWFQHQSSQEGGEWEWL